MKGTTKHNTKQVILYNNNNNNNKIKAMGRGGQ
jgi:hypothetical protein